MTPASKDNPRTVENKRSGNRVRCVNQAEYLELTSARGYRDVTDEPRSSPSGRRSRSSSTSASSTSASSTSASSTSASADSAS